MTWEKRVTNFAIGDRVCMKTSFLRDTGQQVGEEAFKRGAIIELKPFGDNQLATIRWDGHDEPGRVITSNLSKVTARGIADE